ncbi:MAG: acyl-CoA dehydrogenase family protein, partial [Pirellulaceae bacterium]
GAAGSMRGMLADLLPWARHRITYGEAIETRELVRRRLGRLAGLIVACDALTDWCAWLLDEGYRGEMECIIAKIFGSESQKEASIELYMKTLGGRAFLHGQLFGDNVHEFLAPCIYEGEGEILGLGFFKSLIKEHGKKYYEPIGRAIHAAGLKNPNPMNPLHAWKLRKAATPWLKWRTGQSMGGWRPAKLPALPKVLEGHARFAADSLQRSRLDVDALMRQYQLTLGDRQCAMSELSSRIQSLIVMLTTALWAGRKQDPVVHEAAAVMCSDMRRRVAGGLPSASEFRLAAQLGKKIADGQFKAIAGVEPNEILMPYENE